MIEWGALVLAIVKLVASILDDRRATRPEREARTERKDVLSDVDGLNTAIRERDPGGIAAFFETERREALGRLDIVDADGGVQPSDRDHSGQPDASPAPERRVGRD